MSSSNIFKVVSSIRLLSEFDGGLILKENLAFSHLYLNLIARKTMIDVI